MLKRVNKMKSSEEKAEYVYNNSLDWVNALDVRNTYYDLLKDVRTNYSWILLFLFVQVIASFFPEVVINPSTANQPVTMFWVGIFAFVIVLVIVGNHTKEWFKLNEIITKKELGTSYREIFASLEEEEDE